MSSKPGASQPRWQPGEVPPLARDQVGGDDVPDRAAPARPGADHGDVAVVVGQVQLGEQRQPVAPLVGGAGDADLPAEPAVGQDDAERVAARAGPAPVTS